MRETATPGFFDNVLLTTERLVNLLGFHDLTSFVLTLVMAIVLFAFVIAAVVALFKSRRERLYTLKKIVEQAQLRATEEKITDVGLPEPLTKVIDEKADLAKILKSTRSSFIQKLARLFNKNGQEIDDADLEELEAILYTADIGVKTATKLLQTVKNRVKNEKNNERDFLQTVLKEEMRSILKSAKPINKDNAIAPKVILFVGVNGAGKTTSIAKLGAKIAKQGQKVLFGAGDTFRAAAVKQLSVWGERVQAEVVSGKEGADSASVLFEAIKKAQNNNVDVVLCDTAGRLHTKQELMDELNKVYRVIAKAKAGAPDEVYLVIDATMGQNAIMQAREFAESTPLSGIIISKLDGTAKGGVLLGIVDELKVPICYIGVGESLEDLQEFEADAFIDALFENTHFEPKIDEKEKGTHYERNIV